MLTFLHTQKFAKLHFIFNFDMEMLYQTNLFSFKICFLNVCVAYYDKTHFFQSSLITSQSSAWRRASSLLMTKCWMVSAQQFGFKSRSVCPGKTNHSSMMLISTLSFFFPTECHHTFTKKSSAYFFFFPLIENSLFPHKIYPDYDSPSLYSSQFLLSPPPVWINSPFFLSLEKNMFKR